MKMALKHSWWVRLNGMSHFKTVVPSVAFYAVPSPNTHLTGGLHLPVHVLPLKLMSQSLDIAGLHGPQHVMHDALEDAHREHGSPALEDERHEHGPPAHAGARIENGSPRTCTHPFPDSRVAR